MKTLADIRSLIAPMVLSAALMGLMASTAGAAATRVAQAIWVHGELYDTVVTPTSFQNAPAHSTDVIYSFMMSGLVGQRSIAASAPGDRDYNGGRWSVKAVVFTETGLAAHDPDGDGQANFELKSEEDLAAHYLLGHLEIVDTDIRFECPVLPRR